MKSLAKGLQRRIERMKRRRKVGRAYDMALEISRLLPLRASILDVGCGNGFIAHHLAGILKSPVVGMDVGPAPRAAIDFVPYDGRHFPLGDETFDAVLLCYVLHHAQDAALVLNEVARVLKCNGVAIIYEDIPMRWLDRAACWIHNHQWQKRTGACTFRLGSEWRRLFSVMGFELVLDKELSRWRNMVHPVSRRFFVLRVNAARAIEDAMHEANPQKLYESVPLVVTSG
jgi:ubiquinone/menaquinone biosynthesis C-methylase UbiE